MRVSQNFAQTSRGTALETGSVNHDLLSRAGFVDQLMAGAYSYLPLGLRTLRKIENIVREEMNSLGASEIIMPTLHPKANWVTTGGWDKIDVLFKLKSRTGNDYALGQSEEEVVAPLVLGRAVSYKNFPVKTYQIGWKYRDELRAKSGIIRGREFYMKDLYSFHTSQADFDAFFTEAKQAYLRIFDRLGLTAKVTEASGGSFSEKISYEFEVLTDAGEDVIYYCSNCDFCVEDEIAKVKPGDLCPRCGKEKLKEAKSAEVGNVFDLGQKYARDFDLTYADESNQKQYAIMGCYGIGISRVLGVIAETYHDHVGLIWPAQVAPFKVHLIRLGNDASVESAADNLYLELREVLGDEVLYDDTDRPAGVKFADSDLIGCPWRVTVSAKTLADGSAEIKARQKDDASFEQLAGVTQVIAERIAKS